MFANHNLYSVELYAYSNVSVEDEHTERFKKYFYKWNNIVNLSDELVSELIYQDEIDILIDGCGHMMDTRLNVFKYKPAPIQVTWLGSAWTTGLPTIDYVLFDPYMAPEGTLASENILRLPRTWTAFRPGKRAISVDVKESPLTLNNYITFGYSGRSERLNYKVFNVWGQILSKIPNAKLILDYKSFEDKGNQSYYIKLMQVYGVDTNRIIFRNSIL